MGTNPNPYAPPAYRGLVPQYPSGYVDVDFTYPYDVSLTALQALTDQAVAIHVDSDFCWRSLLLADYDGAFSIRFSDAQGYFLSAAKILNGNFLSGGVPYPFPIFPELILPAGSRLGIEITDLSNDDNDIEILFRGVKRYTLPNAPR